MNYAETQVILDALKDICDLQSITVTTENTNWRGKPYRSDYVLLETEYKVGFEVLENEIIAYYFGDHCHFEDYTSELEEGGTPYVQRAIAFFRRLFTTPLQIMEKRKSGKLLRRELFFLLPDGRRESVDGPWIERLFSNPFVKPSYDLTNYSYHKESGQFHNVQDGTAITRVINYSNQLLAEIHKRPDGSFTYSIAQKLYDDDSCDWFWMPVYTGCSLFDTEEKAAEAAQAEAETIKTKT